MHVMVHLPNHIWTEMSGSGIQYGKQRTFYQEKCQKCDSYFNAVKTNVHIRRQLAVLAGELTSDKEDK